MVTEVFKIHSRGGRTRRLYLREHRLAGKVSVPNMAGRLGIERESVYRIERGNERLKAKWQGDYAVALGIAPEDLSRPPGTISLDSLAQQVPEEDRDLAIQVAADALKRFAEGRK